MYVHFSEFSLMKK